MIFMERCQQALELSHSSERLPPWIQPDRHKATMLLGCPDLTLLDSFLLHCPLGCVTPPVLMEGQSCKRGTWWELRGALGILSTGLSIVSSNHPWENVSEKNLYPEQPRLFHLIGNINHITAVFYPALVTGELKARFATERQ